MNKRTYPNFPPDYVPNVVEIHDHLGLLVKIEAMQIVVENSRPAEYEPKLICWFFDGVDSINLAYVHSEHKVLINRISELHALNNLNQALGL